MRKSERDMIIVRLRERERERERDGEQRARDSSFVFVAVTKRGSRHFCSCRCCVVQHVGATGGAWLELGTSATDAREAQRGDAEAMDLAVHGFCHLGVEEVTTDRLPPIGRPASTNTAKPSSPPYGSGGQASSGFHIHFGSNYLEFILVQAHMNARAEFQMVDHETPSAFMRTCHDLHVLL